MNLKEGMILGVFIGLAIGVPVTILLVSNTNKKKKQKNFSPALSAPTYSPVETGSKGGFENEATYEAVRDGQGRLLKYIVHRKVVPIAEK